MTRFCTQCGTSNEDQARFCDACGKPFKEKKQTALPSCVALMPSTTARTNSRLFPLLGGGAVLLLLAVVSGYYLLQPQKPSASVFANAIDQYMAANPAVFQDKICLSNFPYSKSPVLTNGFDQQTNAWIGELVAAGLYTAPQQVNNGFFAQLRYSLTAKGQAAIKNGKLCIANGIHVTSVTSFSAPQNIGGLTVSQATYQYQLNSPAAWANQSIQQQLSQQNALSANSIVMMLKDRYWVVPNPDDMKKLDQAAGGQFQAEILSALTRTQPAQSGFFAWIHNLFGPAAPSQADIWQALINYSPAVQQYQNGFSMESCQHQGDGPYFTCQIHINSQIKQIVLLKNGNGVWTLKPSLF
jgi:hypothetical protein